MSTATLGGLTVTRCVVQIPAWGFWFADVEVDDGTVLAGSVVLAVADATFAGTILTGGAVSGRGRWRVVGGAGGWGSDVAARHYVNDAGIKQSKILADVAAEVGETVEGASSDSVGSAWTREAGPASWVLESVAPAGWYIDTAGVTQIGTWPEGAEAVGTRVEPHDPARGRVVLAADSIALLVPGVTVDGQAVVDVEHKLDAGKLRTTLWTARGSATSRGLSAMARLIVGLLGDWRYRGTWEYRIVSQTGERLNLQVVRRSTGMPDLRLVRVRPGVPGVRADHKLGSLALVVFVDGDPARPAVVGFDDADSAGFLPTDTEIDGTDTIAVGASASAVELASGSEGLISPLELGRVVRYGDVFAAVTGGAPAPMTTDTPYVVMGGLVGSPVAASKVSA